jgi:hypothetical protein
MKTAVAFLKLKNLEVSQSLRRDGRCFGRRFVSRKNISTSETSGFMIVTYEDCRREPKNQEKLLLGCLMFPIILEAKEYHF